MQEERALETGNSRGERREGNSLTDTRVLVGNATITVLVVISHGSQTLQESAGYRLQLLVYIPTIPLLA